MKSEIKKTHCEHYLPSWKWPLILSLLLTIVFAAGRILGLGQNLSYLLDGSDLIAAGYGLIYIVLYLMIVLVVPVLLIYTGFLWLFSQLIIKSHKTSESDCVYAKKGQN